MTTLNDRTQEMFAVVSQAMRDEKAFMQAASHSSAGWASAGSRRRQMIEPIVAEFIDSEDCEAGDEWVGHRNVDWAYADCWD